MSKTKKWLHVCRACLTSSNDIFPIFEPLEEFNITAASMLHNLSLEISDKEDLPRNLCRSCYTKLQVGSDFVETFKNSQKILRNSLNNYAERNVIFKDDFESTVDKNQSFDLLSEGNPFDRDTESFIIECENSDKKSSSCDSDDQDYLIKRSVELSQQYKINKWNGNDSDSDDDSRESETVEFEQATKSVEKEKPCFENTVLSCPVCLKKFRRFTLFSSHMHQHSCQINCELCSLEFNDPGVYLNHYQTKHRYQCNICQKSFLTRSSYNKHKYTHSNASPRFICPVLNCPKMFNRKQSLHNHIASIHSEKRNFLCNICGASFKNRDNLRYHMKKHTGAPHLCTYCGRTFMQAGHLKYHMWRHTGEKPYKCNKCHKGFVSKWVLTMHVKKNCGQGRK
ncbi:zinc finger protein 484-like [Tribolium madens]|uniref:zinc finger protein 484-like n=1 Tax=Tribolium madens TaxID=41895 RepID=UPI001CF73A56|nr:zinc finger protein 484-like [Tribolium madens]